MDGDHACIETRRAAVLADVEHLGRAHRLPGLAAIGRITATREITGRTTTAIRHFLLSGPMPAADLLRVLSQTR